MKLGFDMKKFYELSTNEIQKRIEAFGEKLYLEVGGKLFDDMHAARVLPGFQPDAKINILKRLKEKVEILFVISASQIEKVRNDNELTYANDVLIKIDKLRKQGLFVSAIIITLFEAQPEVMRFKAKLERRGERVFVHTRTKGYPHNIEQIVSEEGYGQNPFVETSRPIVVVTAPGPGGGKLATCLCQMYHENKRGVRVGYSKLETFPIWNLPLTHPVNVAYEAGTIDLKDINMIDPFHFYAYGVTAVNYNRDIEAFPLLKKLLVRITGGKDVFKSPTDMGLNFCKDAIKDDEICKKAARREILRRYFNALVDIKCGFMDTDRLEWAQKLVDSVGAGIADRPVIAAAREKSKETGTPAFAIELANEVIITGRETSQLTSAAACVLNAIKAMSGISDKTKLLKSEDIKAIFKMKRELLDEASCKLNLYEVLCVLMAGGNSGDESMKAAEKLNLLRGLEAHSSCILNTTDRRILKKLGLNLTCDAVFDSENLYND